jgi:cytochrome b involved in lipid metabolism
MKKNIFILTLIILVSAGCSKTTTNTTPEISSTQNTISKATSTPSSSVKTFSMEEVKLANNKDNCLTVINGQVYNLTKWIDQHPGGDRNILKICGIDGSSAFNNQHGGQKRAEVELKNFVVGSLAK